MAKNKWIIHFMGHFLREFILKFYQFIKQRKPRPHSIINLHVCRSFRALIFYLGVCKEDAQIANAELVSSTGVLHMDVRSYKCSDGFQWSDRDMGEKSINCLGDGTWTVGEEKCLSMFNLYVHVDLNLMKII